MGNPKLKWTAEEEEALRAGVAKHGAGKWKNIQRDPEFNHLLFARSNIDLKDKWRNLGVAASGSLPREKAKVPKGKGDGVETSAASSPNAQKAPVAPVQHEPVTEAAAAVVDESQKPVADANTAGAAKLNVLIYEAISTLRQPTGSDSSAIANYIEQHHEPPVNFKRALSSRLRRLVQQDKLEKIQNHYYIKKDGVLIPEPRTPTTTTTTTTTITTITNQKEIPPRPLPVFGHVADDSLEEATVAAAYRIAEAEHKSSIAADAVKEAERASHMAEEMESLLQFATYCFELSEQGDIMIVV